jgi:hypothetical protein
MTDPYLPMALYDRHNALVYCDSCNRLYHQKCHFVPLLVIPRSDWNCLICSLQKQQQKQKCSTAWKKYTDPMIANQLFPSPPPLTTTTTTTNALEHDWERATAAPKAQLWHQQFKHMKTFLNTQAYNVCMATSALETLTSTKRNRAHYLATFMATTNGRKQQPKKSSSQELAQTLLRLAMGKWKIRNALQSLESIRNNVVDNCLLDEWCRHLFQ